MVSLDEVKEYLGITWEEPATDKRLNSLITVADNYFTGALGANYPKTDPRVKEMALIVIGQLYDNTDGSLKTSKNVERLVYDFSWQIRLDMRGGNGAI